MVCTFSVRLYQLGKAAFFKGTPLLPTEPRWSRISSFVSGIDIHIYALSTYHWVQLDGHSLMFCEAWTVVLWIKKQISFLFLLGSFQRNESLSRVYTFHIQSYSHKMEKLRTKTSLSLVKRKDTLASFIFNIFKQNIHHLT